MPLPKATEPPYGFWRLSNPFAIDLRSVALFRITLALCVLFDLIDRARDFRAHYTDFGMLPRAALLEHFINQNVFCLHLAVGTAVGTTGLFLLQAFFALLLLAGLHSRLMALLSWFFLYSLHLRNPIVLQGGDDLLRMMLVWSVFLPLGAAYSIDHALEKAPMHKTHVHSLGTVALVVQVLLVYIMAALLKTGEAWRSTFTAVYEALSFEQLTTATGMWLYHLGEAHRWLLPFFTCATFYFEAFGWLLLVAPFAALRLVGALSFTLMHVMFGLCLILGMFPVIDAVSMTIFVPTAFWQWLGAKRPKPPAQTLTVYYDADCDFCRKLTLIFKEFLCLPHAVVRAAQEEPEAHRLMQAHASWIVRDGATYHAAWLAFVALCRHSPIVPGHLSRALESRVGRRIGTPAYYAVANRRGALSRVTAMFLPWRNSASLPGKASTGLCGGLFVAVIWWNIAAIPQATQLRVAQPIGRLLHIPQDYLGVYTPEALRTFAYGLRIDQSWGMFSPFPQRDDGWYVFPGTLIDGTKVDAYRRTLGEPSQEKPELVSALFSGQRWNKLMMNIWLARNADYRLHLGKYLCRAYNGAGNVRQAKALSKFEIDYFRQDTLDDFRVSPAEKVVIWSHDCFK